MHPGLRLLLDSDAPEICIVYCPDLYADIGCYQTLIFPAFVSDFHGYEGLGCNDSVWLVPGMAE